MHPALQLGFPAAVEPVPQLLLVGAGREGGTAGSKLSPVTTLPPWSEVWQQRTKAAAGREGRRLLFLLN